MDKGLVHWHRKAHGWSASGSHDGEPWPTRTNVHCFWCCHPFDTIPIPLPVYYDDRLDRFYVSGTFCSWSCAKAFNVYSGASNWPQRNEWLRLLYGRTVPKEDRAVVRGIPTALSRTRLTMFGGDLDIDRFRTMSGDTSCRKPILSRLDWSKVHIVDGSTCAAEREPSEKAQETNLKPLTFDNLNPGKNETLKLRRTKPLPSKTSNILEKVLGIKPSAPNPPQCK